MNNAAGGAGAEIRARGLTKHYDEGRIRAVDGLDLSVAPGEFVAICGPSGCGKTTLLNLITAMERPDAGALQVAGHSVPDLSRLQAETFRRSVVGLVFQLHNLLANLTALENVQVPMMATGMAARRRLERARELLGHVGLQGRAGAQPSVLSGGERQRVAIARALANRPRIVLADEPTGALDSGSGERFMDLLGQVQREQHTTLVIVTHDPLVAERADRVLHMLDGRMVDA